MNPLDQLLPPIAPPPVAWWPPAPGWWALLVAALLTLGLLLVWRSYRRRPPREQPAIEATLEPQRLAALEELASMSRPYGGQPAGEWLQQINGLLKRLSRTRYVNDHPHTLTGRAWLAFLDSRCPAAGLTRWMVLVEGTYRAECRLDDRAIDELNQAVDTWIRRHV